VEGKMSGSGFRIFGDVLNKLEIVEVSLVVSPTCDSRVTHGHSTHGIKTTQSSPNLIEYDGKTNNFIYEEMVQP
jgi:hypothetical protein